MNPLHKTLLFPALSLGLCAACAQPECFTSLDEPRARVVVLTDAEIDDQCSMVRFLLNANEFDVEAIITTSSMFHWQGHHWAGDDWMDRFLSAYREVWPNLVKHDAAYPAPDALEKVTMLGNVSAEGEMEEQTPGSRFIADLLLDEQDARPIWFQAWGGLNTLARALKSIEEEHPDRMEAVAAKIRIYTIWEQDDSYRNYILPVWGKYDVPTIFSDQFWCLAYPWRESLPEEVRPLFEGKWMKEYVLENHGPLCALYPNRDGNFISEGDSPSFLYNIRTGLNVMEHPEWGGWGGRYVSGGTRSYYDPAPEGESDWTVPEGRYSPDNAWLGRHRGASRETMLAYYAPIGRWADAFQHDFAARADWCVKSYDEANHAPVVCVTGEQERPAAPGKTLSLDARRSSDPDGDALSFRWWYDAAAGTGGGTPVLQDESSARCKISLPADAVSGETYHVICEVTDQGEPTLTRYARVIVTIR